MRRPGIRAPSRSSTPRARRWPSRCRGRRRLDPTTRVRRGPRHRAGARSMRGSCRAREARCCWSCSASRSGRRSTGSRPPPCAAARTRAAPSPGSVRRRRCSRPCRRAPSAPRTAPRWRSASGADTPSSASGASVWASSTPPPTRCSTRSPCGRSAAAGSGRCATRWCGRSRGSAIRGGGRQRSPRRGQAAGRGRGDCAARAPGAAGQGARRVGRGARGRVGEARAAPAAARRLDHRR